MLSKGARIVGFDWFCQKWVIKKMSLRVNDRAITKICSRIRMPYLLAFTEFRITTCLGTRSFHRSGFPQVMQVYFEIFYRVNWASVRKGCTFNVHYKEIAAASRLDSFACDFDSRQVLHLTATSVQGGTLRSDMESATLDCFHRLLFWPSRDGAHNKNRPTENNN